GNREDFYEAILENVLKFRKPSAFLTLVLIVGSIAATPFMGAEFMPAVDQGQYDIKVVTRASGTLAATEEVTDHMTKAVEAYEDIINVSFVSIGEGGVDGSTSADNEASYTIELVSADERDVTTKELVTELDEKLAHIVGAEVTVSEADGGLG